MVRAGKYMTLSLLLAPQEEGGQTSINHLSSESYSFVAASGIESQVASVICFSQWNIPEVSALVQKLEKIQ